MLLAGLALSATNLRAHLAARICVCQIAGAVYPHAPCHSSNSSSIYPCRVHPSLSEHCTKGHPRMRICCNRRSN
eukprot:2481255-Pleurochrysis_carterae.AAC.4